MALQRTTVDKQMCNISVVLKFYGGSMTRKRCLERLLRGEIMKKRLRNTALVVEKRKKIRTLKNPSQVLIPLTYLCAFQISKLWTYFLGQYSFHIILFFLTLIKYTTTQFHQCVSRSSLSNPSHSVITHLTKFWTSSNLLLFP